jgi:hypothetical protein
VLPWCFFLAIRAIEGTKFASLGYLNIGSREGRIRIRERLREP